MSRKPFSFYETLEKYRLKAETNGVNNSTAWTWQYPEFPYRIWHGEYSYLGLERTNVWRDNIVASAWFYDEGIKWIANNVDRGDYRFDEQEFIFYLKQAKDALRMRLTYS